MPNTSCVPLCRSNYDDKNKYSTVFKFPSEAKRPELRRTWIQCVHRKDWVPTKVSVVCIKHFQKEDTILVFLLDTNWSFRRRSLIEIAWEHLCHLNRLKALALRNKQPVDIVGKYVFIYFNVRGRGEAMRYLMTENDIDFEEIVCSADNWYTEWKPKMQFGQLPALRDGDLQVVQSNAILRHLARKHGLYGSSIEEAAQIDMLNDGVEDMRVKYGGMIYKNYEAGKDAYIAELPSQLQPFERSFVDYNLMDILDIHQILAPKCLDNFPALSAFYKLNINRPRIAEHRKTEEFKKRTVNGNGKQ